MKKFTFLIFAIFYFGLQAEISAQTFNDENFDGLTVGNVGTNINGAAAGQGGYLTIANSGQNSDFQIIDEGGTYGNVLQIAGSSTDTGEKFLYKGGLASSWANRDNGNDILEVEFDFYSGSVTTSRNTFYMVIANSSNQVLAGFLFDPDTKNLLGLSRTVVSGTVITNQRALGDNSTDVVLNPETWYRVGLAFNSSTGEVTWRGDDFYDTANGSDAGATPDKISYNVFPGVSNTVSFLAKVDATKSRFTPTENLLGISNRFKTKANLISIYPNPVQGEIRVSALNTMSVKNIEIVDVNGRTVKSVSIYSNSENQLDTSTLSSGLYFLNIYSSEGKITKRFIKS